MWARQNLKSTLARDYFFLPDASAARYIHSYIYFSNLECGVISFFLPSPTFMDSQPSPSPVTTQLKFPQIERKF